MTGVGMNGIVSWERQTPIKVWPPVNLGAYALVSGGKDSMTLAHVLASRDWLRGCIAFDTGIAIPEWRDFLTTECARQNWPLQVLDTSVTYEDIVRRYGFPGPGLHGVYMNLLKGRALRQFAKEGRGSLLASGVRIGESRRRFHSVREWSVFEGLPIWAPLIQWTTQETWDYFTTHGLVRSPAYATLGISGDCLCGAFAHEGEREILAVAYPALQERLCRLEQECDTVWGKGRARRGRKGGWERVVCVECDPTGQPQAGTA